MPPLELTLMEKLIIIRLRHSWGTEEAGKHWGVPGATLRAYENGRRNPREPVRQLLERVVTDYEKRREVKSLKPKN